VKQNKSKFASQNELYFLGHGCIFLNLFSDLISLYFLGYHYWNLALCRVLNALLSVFYWALGKVLLSVTTAFAESRNLGKKLFAECLTLGERRRSAKGRQQPSIDDGR
jgi:hypothetical protein